MSWTSRPTASRWETRASSRSADALRSWSSTVIRAMMMGTSDSDTPNTCQCDSGWVFHNREAATRRPAAMTTVGIPRRSVVENRSNEQKKGKKQTVHHPSAGSVSTVKKA